MSDNSRDRQAPVTGATRVAAVIGSPVRHSLSPVIHNAAFAAANVDAVYLALPVDAGAGADAVHAMRTFAMLGLSVTMPHKAEVLEACDRLSDMAAALGSANCLYWSGDSIVGDNTDGEGFVRGLADELAVDPAGMRCVVLGAGGAARAVVRALATAEAAEVVVINRSADRATEAAAHAGAAGRVGSQRDLADADLVVNATPLGMAGTPAQGELPFDVAAVRHDTVVSDLIYNPAQTPLLAQAAARGLTHQNGLSMLVFQAAVAFERWTGIDAPIEAMKAAVASALIERQ